MCLTTSQNKVGNM